jgi:hypothetical protein
VYSLVCVKGISLYFRFGLVLEIQADSEKDWNFVFSVFIFGPSVSHQFADTSSASLTSFSVLASAFWVIVSCHKIKSSA